MNSAKCVCTKHVFLHLVNIPAALEHFIIILCCVTFYHNQNIAASEIWILALTIL